MELVQKQVRYMQEKPSITDQFQMDEDYNVPDTKDDVKQIVRSKETVKIEDINLIENYLRVSGKLCFQILYIVDSEENRLASLEGKIPFEEMVYVTDMGKDEFFIKHVRTEFQSALIHSRKISLHAMIELEIGREQMQEEETTIKGEGNVYKTQKTPRAGAQHHIDSRHIVYPAGVLPRNLVDGLQQGHPQAAASCGERRY